MAFIVHVEAVINGMALQIGHETSYVDNGHDATLPFERVPIDCRI